MDKYWCVTHVECSDWGCAKDWRNAELATDYIWKTNSREERYIFSVQNTSSCSCAQNTRPINQSEQKLDQIPIPGCCCSSSYLQCFARGSPLLQVQLSLLRTSTTPMHSAFTFFLLSFYFSNCFYSCFKILQSCLICYMLLFICLIVFSLCFFSHFNCVFFVSSLQ